MKISEMEEQLRELRQQFGDLEVIIGEAGGVYRDRINVNADTVGDEGQTVCIVQAVVVLGK